MDREYSSRGTLPRQTRAKPTIARKNKTDALCWAQQQQQRQCSKRLIARSYLAERTKTLARRKTVSTAATMLSAREKK